MTYNRSKIWLKPTDQMDLWLETQGFYRKHIARDATCLFRAVAEQLCSTQTAHFKVRSLCVDYIIFFGDKFLKNKLTGSIKEYENRMKVSTEWGGELELEVLSLVFKCDFLLFKEVGKPYENVTNKGFEKQVMLCVSQEKHYDSVYPKQVIADTAYCQSLVYELLYKRAFGLLEVDFAVKKMLHDKVPRCQRDPTYMSINGMALRLEMRDTCLNVKELLLSGVTPFPYKVAKSLDPEIYRNVQYDTWNDYRKGLRYGSRFWTSNELCVGVKCLIKLESDNFHGFIQEMEPDKGPVLVFIEELGKKMSVPYESLELLPPPQPQPSFSPTVGKQLRQIQASKSALNAQPDSTSQQVKKVPKNGIRQKCKDSNDVENKRKNTLNGDLLNDQQSLQSSNYLASTSSECYEHELDYQQDMHDSYQHSHLYPTQSCEVTSSSIDHGGNDQGVNIPCTPVSHYSLNATPNNNLHYQISPSSNPAYCAVNVAPTRSVYPDGSDLPMADLPTLRYYYNIGLDYMRMNYVVPPAPAGRSSAPPASPHCYTTYPVIQSPTQYHAMPVPAMPAVPMPEAVPVPVPMQVPVSYVSYEQPPPAPSSAPPAAYPETVPVSVVRPPMSINSGMSSVMSESDSASYVSSSRNQTNPVAPRFKNKRKNEHQSACPSPPQNNITNQQSTATFNGNESRNRSQSAATPSMPTQSYPVPTSPAPTQVPPPVSTHYLSVQPSYPPTVYYHPVECDRNYCTIGTTGGYFEYNMYDPAATPLYPATVYSTQAVSQTPYLTPDGLYYQPVVQSNAVEY